MIGAVLLGVVALAAGGECAAPPADGLRSCRDHVGWCFDLTVDGQAVVPLDDPALRAKLDRELATPLCWQLAEPTAGTLEAVVKANRHTAGTIGELYDEVEIVVMGLEGQEVPTRKGIRTDPTVRIGGVPMQTQVDVIDTEKLPGGAYVATFRVRGPGGWDRKAVLLHVTRDAP